MTTSSATHIDATPVTSPVMSTSSPTPSSERDRWRGPRDGTLRARRGHVPRSDPELFHLRHERRALEAETRRGATRTCNDAVRLAEDLEDVLARGVNEGLGLWGGCPGFPHPGVQGRQLQASRRARGSPLGGWRAEARGRYRATGGARASPSRPEKYRR